MKRFLLAAILALFFTAIPASEYSIQAIRYAVSPGFPVAGLVVGGPKDEKGRYRHGDLADSRRGADALV
jgi:hypothetical protein